MSDIIDCWNLSALAKVYRQSNTCLPPDFFRVCFLFKVVSYGSPTIHLCFKSYPEVALFLWFGSSAFFKKSLALSVKSLKFSSY